MESTNISNKNGYEKLTSNVVLSNVAITPNNQQSNSAKLTASSKLSFSDLDFLVKI